MDTIDLCILGSKVTLSRRLNGDVVWYGDIGSSIRMSPYSSGYWCVIVEVTVEGTLWNVSASHIASDIADACAFIDGACERLGIVGEVRSALGLSSKAVAA
jgi:hypothetical protein